MSKNQNVFTRYEKKYLLNEEQYRGIEGVLSEFFDHDKYYAGTISNVYYDTPDFLLIRRSLEKPTYKEKLRLRSYKTPSSIDSVFVELKKKFKGVVYKRRMCAPLQNAENFLENKEHIVKESQIEKEIKWFLSFYNNLAPKMYLSYERRAYRGKEDKNLRLTVDENILWRDYDLDLRKGPYGTPILDENQYLIEVKCMGAMPLWLSKVFDRLKIYPTSFSKYGKAYLAKQNNIYIERQCSYVE